MDVTGCCKKNASLFCALWNWNHLNQNLKFSTALFLFQGRYTSKGDFNDGSGVQNSRDRTNALNLHSLTF